MGYQIYKVGNRWGGYGVPAVCEHPECNKEIDRGLSFACGGEPFSEMGCDRYFCHEHLHYVRINTEINMRCRHKKDCDCDLIPLCDRCAKRKSSFPYKPETEDWINHLITDESWKQWREENPQEVESLKTIKMHKPY